MLCQFLVATLWQRRWLWLFLVPREDSKINRRFESPVGKPQSVYQKHNGLSYICFGAAEIVLCQFWLPVLCQRTWIWVTLGPDTTQKGIDALKHRFGNLIRHIRSTAVCLPSVLERQLLCYASFCYQFCDHVRGFGELLGTEKDT